MKEKIKRLLSDKEFEAALNKSDWKQIMWILLSTYSCRGNKRILSNDELFELLDIIETKVAKCPFMNLKRFAQDVIEHSFINVEIDSVDLQDYEPAYRLSDILSMIDWARTTTGEERDLLYEFIRKLSLKAPDLPWQLSNRDWARENPTKRDKVILNPLFTIKSKEVTHMLDKWLEESR